MIDQITTGAEEADEDVAPVARSRRRSEVDVPLEPLVGVGGDRQTVHTAAGAHTVSMPNQTSTKVLNQPSQAGPQPTPRKARAAT